MYWTQARAVRNFLTALVVASTLTFTSSLYAEGRDKPRGRERDDRDARQAAVERSSTSRQAPSASTQARPAVEARQPGRPADQSPGRAVQPAQPAGDTRGTPVNQGGPRQARPQPARDDRNSQRQERVAPDRSNRAPEQRTAPATPPQRQRPEPAYRPDRSRQPAPQQPIARERPQAQPWRVDTERPVRNRERQRGVEQPAPAQQDRPKAQPLRRTPDTQDSVRAGERPQLRRDTQRDQERIRPREGNGQAKQAPAPSGKGRVQGVPEARFRGPEADRNVKIVQPEDRDRAQKQFRERVRTRNQERGPLTRGRPTVDDVGNLISSDTTIIVRDSVSRLSVGFGHVRKQCGDPTFVYVFAPRHPSDYWDGYWDGYTDGYWAGKNHWHGHHTVISFYYGYYWSDPYWFAFYYPGYYPAVYHYWGWSPGWVYPERCYYAPDDYLYAPVSPYRYYGTDYRVDERGADEALGDIRRAWYDSDITSLSYHLTDDVDIRVYFDGEYQYSTTTEDYYTMTVDAMATTQTVALTFNDPIWLSSHEFFVTGRHQFYDPNGDRQTVYLSYRLRKLGGDWYIVSVGSSLEPIQHHYSDFRY